MQKPKVLKIDHVAIVVEDLDNGLNFWRDGLGLDLSRVEEVPEQEASIAFLPTGESEIELVKPTTDDSGLAKYLAKRGQGMHHICFEVDNIINMLSYLKEIGVRLIDETPKDGSGGKKLAFIHPESTNGVLVELYQLPNKN